MEMQEIHDTQFEIEADLVFLAMGFVHPVHEGIINQLDLKLDPRGNVLANDIADPSNICEWNPDMYGIRPEAEGAQEYYDSIFGLYAQWGVDFIKCDDICRMDMPSAKKEIEMLYNALCGSEPFHIMASIKPL